MKLIHNGQVKEFTAYEWQDEYEASNPERRADMEEMVREGTLVTNDGETLTGVALHRMRARLLDLDGRYFQPFAGRRHKRNGPRRFLIPDLWAWATIPALSGTYKAGRSTVVADLTRALLVPGYRFLDHFEPVEMTDEERDRGVVVVNVENPPEDFEAVLSVGMTDEAWQRLVIEHLDNEGGAHFMDLTDPDIYDLWVSRLAWCDECDGSDFSTPVAVIVDGVTAIGLAVGKSPEDYFGRWYAAFRRLLHECDIPNGLAVGHSTMAGGHLMGGTASSAGPDGLWTYSADQVDSPTSPRRFAFQPRLVGVAMAPTRVVQDETGRLVIRAKKTAEQSEEDHVEEVEVEDPVTVIAHRMAEYVREHPGAGGQELVENVDHGGWKQNALAGRAKAVDLGLVTVSKCGTGCTVCQKPHHNRWHYWPAPPTTTV